ncbi:MAG: amidohydrolase family protein [Myxococcota bacterium]
MISVRHAFVGGRFVEGVTVRHEGGRLTEVRPRRAGDPEPLHGTLLPGLVNAHLHLELSWTAGLVPGGKGFDAWVARSLALQRPDDTGPAVDRAVEDLVAYGTAAVSDICNGPDPQSGPRRGPDTGARFAEAGIGGVVQRELFGLHAPRQPALLDRAAEPPVRHEGRVPVVSRTSPHATYSMHRPLLEATVRADGLGHPASIHVSEDLQEHAFLADGSGPQGPRLDGWGLEWRSWEPPGLTPTGWLASLDLLGPGLLLVHGVHLTPADLALVAASGSPLCLCPRSNLHIGGRLPDVPALIAASVPLALGTDGLGSTPDLDVLSEIPVLQRAFPEVPVERFVAMATSGGADALRLPWAGRLEVGRAPGLLLIDGPPVSLCTAPRRWLEPPGEAA